MSPDASENLPTTDEPRSDFRAECYRCFRAKSVCICDRVPVIANQTGVIVLQHHREVLHPIGTARIARLGFRNVSVRIARRSQSLAVDSNVPPNTALLYPRPDARNLDEIDPSEFPANLMVLDGTWSQANSMYRSNPWLHDLPHLVIEPPTESNYRIRRQPKSGCLSTIEALVYALKRIEPGTTGFDKLLHAFDTMIDDQLSRMTSDN